MDHVGNLMRKTEGQMGEIVGKTGSFLTKASLVENSFTRRREPPSAAPPYCCMLLVPALAPCAALAIGLQPGRLARQQLSAVCGSASCSASAGHVS